MSRTHQKGVKGCRSGKFEEFLKPLVIFFFSFQLSKSIGHYLRYLIIYCISLIDPFFRGRGGGFSLFFIIMNQPLLCPTFDRHIFAFHGLNA